jgi:hypothetical protein
LGNLARKKGRSINDPFLFQRGELKIKLPLPIASVAALVLIVSFLKFALFSRADVAVAVVSVLRSVKLLATAFELAALLPRQAAVSGLAILPATVLTPSAVLHLLPVAVAVIPASVSSLRVGGNDRKRQTKCRGRKDQP